jgi:phosphatidylinositol alpha-1,6-mannosyltransferase
MKRVVYLTPGVFNKGGISRYGRHQVRALRELLGEDAVSVISLDPPAAGDFEEPFAVDFASFGSTGVGKALFAAGAAAAVARLEGPGRDRAIFCAHLHLGPLALALARLSRARLVLDVYGAEVWSNVTARRAAVLRRADVVISDCHNTLDYLDAEGLRPRSRTVVHWDCVDLARFSPGEAGDVLARYGVPESSAVTVLTLGRMAPGTEYKGYDRLLDVFARIAPEVPVRLVLAGDGARRPDLERRAISLGLAGRAFFTGAVREQDLPALYRAGDVFSLVTTTGYGAGEGIPLTPLEAAAAGRPILVGDQDGSHEAVEDGVSGFVVPSFDLDALRERIVQLAGDPDLRARLGAAGRARIVREHGYERFRERVAEVLHRMDAGG